MDSKELFLKAIVELIVEPGNEDTVYMKQLVLHLSE